MAIAAMVATAAMTAVSMAKMNQAARFAASGEGWVIPMVLMKAFAMNSMNFTVVRCGLDSMVAGIGHVFLMTESKGRCVHLLLRACRRGGRRIHLKLSERDKEICRCLLHLLPRKSLLARPASTTPVTLTPAAITRFGRLWRTQNPVPAGLRIGVVGGGCSGFQYSMSFENQSGMMDKVYKFEDLKVFVDATSAMYLQNCTVDYVETLEAAGFKFENAAVKSTCGCGSSFSV